MAVKALIKPEWAAEVLSADQMVVVKLGAPWCGPCKMIAPVLETLSEEMTDVKFLDVNIDDPQNDGLAAALNVRGVPTILIFKEGERVAQKTGNMTKADLVKLIESAQ